MTELRYLEETPAVDEYRDLRVRAGLSAKTVEAAEAGLPGTFHAVCVRDGDTLVGMGRLVGDGGLNFEIVDMAVDPDHQRQGIGHRVMEMLMGHLRAVAPPSAYVSLIADEGAPPLYERFGFVATAPASIGMALKL